MTFDWIDNELGNSAKLFLSAENYMLRFVVLFKKTYGLKL